jgi:RNA-directed DNA polymerase
LSKTKSFSISKEVVGEAYKRVKANRGTAGVDNESLEDFEENLVDNLYKIWNRMSSGSYFPPPVKTVEIDKDGTRKRKLGIPTVADRIAQTVVKIHLEPIIEPHFHPDSFGYRPGKSAIQAVGKARELCWRKDWVLDLDIKGFFDNIDHEITLSLLAKHTDSKWIHLYIKRWLKAPAQQQDGTLCQRTKGTPQGSVISPLLANLYLHYAFDEWMQKNYPTIPFERYADDIIVHCRSEKQACWVKARIEERLAEFELELNLKKTKIVYCKDSNRKGNNEDNMFTFLGYDFRPRKAKNKYGTIFQSFIPAVSKKATNEMKRTIRNWRSLKLTNGTLEDIAQEANKIVVGWYNYYGKFCSSALYPIRNYIDRKLVKWATRKYKRMKGSQRSATKWLNRIKKRSPFLFAHWCWHLCK